MKISKKLISNVGQVSIELGLLIAGVVLAAVVAGYYYTLTSKDASKIAGETANRTAYNISKSVNTVVDDISSFTG